MTFGGFGSKMMISVPRAQPRCKVSRKPGSKPDFYPIILETSSILGFDALPHASGDG